MEWIRWPVLTDSSTSVRDLKANAHSDALVAPVTAESFKLVHSGGTASRQVRVDLQGDRVLFHTVPPGPGHIALIPWDYPLLAIYGCRTLTDI